MAKKKQPIHNLTYSLLFLSLALLMLFYPGDSQYVRLFFWHRDIFATQRPEIDIKDNFVPTLINPNLTPALTAQGVYIIELSSSTPILQKNAHQSFLPASTTKMITALTAFDAFSLDSVLTVKRIIEEGQTVDFVLGERLTLENLLYAILVHSGNDAAYVIADNFPGGEKAFVEAMNKKAASLSMQSSQFKNPAGLDSFGQHTTPFDLSLAGRSILQNQRLAAMVSVKTITVPDVDFTHFHRLSNVNELLGDLPGVGGLKTGYTIDAGENLLTLYKSGDHEFLITIMKSEDRFTDTRAIVDWINNNIKYITIED